MKKLGWLLVIQLGLFSNVFADDKADITKLITMYGKAMSASDSGAVMQNYALDGVFIPNNLPIAIGWENIKKAYEHEFMKIDLDVNVIIDEILIGTKLASARSRSDGYITILSTNEKKPTSSYRAFFIFKKVDQKWKIAQFMFNFSQ